MRDFGAFVGGKWLYLAGWLTLLLALASYPLQSADAARDAAWPAHWTNPITGKPGGTVTVTADWGVFSRGCTNAPASPEHRYYLRTGTKQHLGIDLRARNSGDTPASGTPVYSIGHGEVIRAGSLWGAIATNGEVAIVDHSSPGVERFTAVYGHIGLAINPQTRETWKNGDAVKPGDLLGRSYPIAQPHLHFGVRRGTHSAVAGMADATVNSDGTCGNATNLNATVDPIPYLEQQRPPLVSGPNACTNVLDRSSAVPTNYGAPFNFFAADRELFFEAFCRGGSNVEIVAGHNYPQQYTYINGFHWNGSRWVNFRFNGPQRQGDWFAGRVSATIPTSSLASSRGAQRNWFVAYTCWNQNGQWRCGCDTPACPERLWQVQGFGFR